MKKLWGLLLLAVSLRSQSAGSPLPLLISQVSAVYTEEARAASLQGTVSLFINVGKDGVPKDVRILHGLGLGLNESAVKAVAQWRYQSATANGRPIEMGMSVDATFLLTQANPWFVRLADYQMGKATQTDPKKPTLVHYVAPDPVACSKTGAMTIVQFTVNKDGVPERFQPPAPGDALAAVAAKAVQSWRFTPGAVDGVPRESEAQIEFVCGPPAGMDTRVDTTQRPDSNPVETYKREPTYSVAAEKAKRRGIVKVAFLVDRAGRTCNIFVLQSIGLGLDEKAVETIKTWRFLPAMRGGVPMNRVASADVKFDFR